MDQILKSSKLLLALTIIVIFGVVACDSELTSSDSSPAEQQLHSVDGSSNPGAANLQRMSNSEFQQRLQEFAENQDREGGVAEAKLKELMPHTGDRNTFRKVITEGVIDSSQFVCSTTPLFEWANENATYASSNEVFFVLFFGIDQYPYLYNLIFVNPEEERQYYGYDGEYTRQVRRVDRSIKRFWDQDVNLNNVDVEGFHGSMLKDFDKVFRLVEVLYPNDTEQSNRDFSQVIVDIVSNDGNDPVWSFNAFAFSGGPILVGGETTPPQIQMGDGILDGMEAIGLEDAAPDVILAHEYGHQIQYDLNVFEQDMISDPAESLRRTELMADAFAAYYLGHKRGASMNWDRVDKFMRGLFNVGDCAFTDPSHHGTPNQRMKAAQWGFDQAENAARRISIMPSGDFVDAFDNALPELVEPDAPDAEGDS